MEQILETMEDIKQNIKDNEYKKIMDGLKIIYYKPEYKAKQRDQEKYVDFINWLENHIIHYNGFGIKKDNLIKYVIINYYNDIYYANIDFVKNSLEKHLKYPYEASSPSYCKDYFRGIRLRHNNDE